MDKTIFGSNKILQHLDNIMDYKFTGVTSPITMEIDFTGRCNHACPKCAGGRLKGELNLEEVSDWLSQMKGYGVKAITYTGNGEPLMNKDTLPAIKYASELGLDVGLITNGGMLNKESCEVIVNNCVWVRVSLDAGSPQTYVLTHGMNETEFNKVIKNVKMLSDAKRRLESDCTVGVGYLTNSKTKDDMERATLLVKGLGVDYLQFRPFHNDFTNVIKEITKCKKYETKSFKVLASTQKYTHFNDEIKRNYSFCHGSNFVGVIQSTGDLTICCHTRGIPKYNYGNLRDKSFEDVWESKKKQQLLKGLPHPKYCPLYCRADGFNRTLQDIMTKKEHVNFL